MSGPRRQTEAPGQRRLRNRPVEIKLQRLAAAVIAEERSRSGVTQDVLAAHVGVTTQQVSKIESGGSSISVAWLIQACQRIGADPSAIVAEIVRRWYAGEHPVISVDPHQHRARLSLGRAIQAIDGVDKLHALLNVARLFAGDQRDEAQDRHRHVDRPDLESSDPLRVA